MAQSLSPAAVASARLLRLPWLALAGVALVAGTGFAHGGYFPASWGWPTVAAAWAAALALFANVPVELGRLGASAAALVAALAAWTALGAAWSLDVTQTVLEAERTSVYCAALLAALLLARRRPERLLHGVWAAAVLLCGWALVTRLVPDRFGVVDPISGYRLSEPIGYWNALGLLAGMGALLGAGLAARASSRLGRALAAASLPGLVLTLYFTFSRGAWVALAAGFVAALALARGRLQLLAVAGAASPWIAIAVWRAAVSPALTTAGSSLTAMTRQGHREALVLVAASAASALGVLGLRAIESRMHVSVRPRRLAGAGLASLAAVAVVAAFVHYGSPATLASHAWKGFSGTGVAQTGSLNGRLFHLSGTGRTAQWHVAWLDVERHPVLGSGAGTYEQAWFRDRPVPSKVRDAHNLYLETLAELGPVGLALLVSLLALPLVAAVRGRERPLAFAAVGAYVAFLLHAAVDWDWEIAAVTLAAILCAAALLAAPGRPLALRGRRVALAGAVLLAAIGVYTIASQLPLSRLASAAKRGDWPAAQRDASRASSLAPWSAEPWLALGEAELNAGRLVDARVALRKAVAQSPDDWSAWYDLARATFAYERTQSLARARVLNPLGPAR